MKRSRSTKSKPIREIGKLYSWYDPLYFIGDAMYRQGIKIGLWTGLITTFEYGQKLFNTPNMSFHDSIKGAALAIGIPVAVGLTLTASGLGVKSLPSVIHKGKIKLAEANDLGLMEDYKASRIEHYLDAIWDRVFQHEADIFFTRVSADDEKKYIGTQEEKTREMVRNMPEDTLDFLGVKSPEHIEELVKALMFARPYTDGIESTKKAFMISSMYALTHPIPETEKARQIGFDLSLLRGWLNGGFFDPANTRIVEQYAGDPDLKAIKRDIGLGLVNNLIYAPGRFWQGLCFNSVTRALAVKIGTAVEEMNRRYDTNEFNSQTFLWPGREDADWLKKYSGAKELIIKYRKDILRSVFGRTFAQADLMLDRILLPSFEDATALRVAFDPEYCTGELGQSVSDDLRSVDCCEKDFSRYESLASSLVENQGNFLGLLHENEPGLFIEGQKEELRAVKIAYHINKNGIRTTYLRHPGNYAKIEREVINAASCKEAYSRKLRSARLHHQLTISDMQEHSDLLKKLSYDDK